VSTYRNNINAEGTAIQQAMTRNLNQYAVEKISQPMLGIILEVRASDNPRNRSAQEWDDLRGFLPECVVYIPSDNLVLSNVLITPDAPCGIDNYYEQLPQGSSVMVDGREIPASLQGVDPFKLDGDWCIVGFLKGIIDSPYVLRWWTNPNNRYDPATSGRAYPNPVTGQGRALDQAGRVFTRKNGVETVISTTGDILVSTRFSNSTLSFEEASPNSVISTAAGTPKSVATSADDRFVQQNTEGRWTRNEREEGGSVKLQIKPTQYLEVDFAPAVDGYAWNDLPNEEVPQTNPEGVKLPPNRISIGNTYSKWDTEQITIDVPVDFTVNSNDTVNFVVVTDFNVDSSGEINQSATTAYNIESSGSFDATITTTANLSAASVTIEATGATQLFGATVQLGSSTAVQPFVQGTSLKAALDAFSVAITAAFSAMFPGAPATPVTGANITAGITAATTAATSLAAALYLSTTITGE